MFLAGLSRRDAHLIGNPGPHRCVRAEHAAPTKGGACMRQHAHIASRRRDERLAMVRKLTLWITGGAAAASLGLGTAFASAVPGHATPATGSTTTSHPASSAAPSQ